MIEDAELLRRFAQEGAEEAFAELVRRHLDFVYGAALRTVGDDAHLAREVCQDVFLSVARKAASLAKHPVFKSWLHTAAQFSAAKAVRTARRRHAREQEAHRMHELNSGTADAARAADLRPVIDAALHDLNETDRAALLLRFFEDRTFAEVGQRLGLSEDAARMRTDRALGKVSGWLSARGITSSAGAVALCFTQQTGVAAPATLAPAIVGAMHASALAGGLTAGSVGWWHLMTVTHAKSTAVGALGLILAGALAFQYSLNTSLANQHNELLAQTRQLAGLLAENARLRRGAADARSAEADAAELARLRAAAIANSTGTTSSTANGPAIAGGLVPIGVLQNRGNATPEATFETLYWAKQHQDYATIEKLIGTPLEERPSVGAESAGLDSVQLARYPNARTPGQYFEAKFAAMTLEERARYPEAATPAQYFARDWAESSGREVAIQIDTLTSIDAERAYLSGHRQIEHAGGTSNADIVFQRTSDGWKWFPEYSSVAAALQLPGQTAAPSPRSDPP